MGEPSWRIIIKGIPTGKIGTTSVRGSEIGLKRNGSASYRDCELTENSLAYGGGRRICPGMHIAERTLWRSMSKILWAFEILPATDPTTGKPKPIYTAAFSANGEKLGFMGAANRVAIPFDVTIEPRSKERVETIQREYAEMLPLLRRFD